MMKKVWKNRKGVSPVIATILMVAITVVLAAVLYVMVMGFNNGTTQAPTVSLGHRAGTTGTYQVYVISVTGGSEAYANAEALVTVDGVASTGTIVQPGTAHSNLEAGDYVVVTASAGQNITVLLKDKVSSSTLGTTSFVGN